MYHNKIEVSWSRYKALITEVQSSRTWSSLGQAEDAKMIWSVKNLELPLPPQSCKSCTACCFPCHLCSAPHLFSLLLQAQTYDKRRKT
jgi:hypothetical protein